MMAEAIEYRESQKIEEQLSVDKTEQEKWKRFSDKVEAK